MRITIKEKSNIMAENGKFKESIPSWVIAGVVIILLPIFAFITIKSINQQQTNYTHLMLEKGIAAIRAFEAGSITGMNHMRWGDEQRNKLLSEIMKQFDDIAYILITDRNGEIVADTNLSEIGNNHFKKSDFPLFKKWDGRNIGWEITTLHNGKKIFEVIKKLHPACYDPECSSSMESNERWRDWRHMGRKYGNPDIDNEKIIFVGFDISSINSEKHTAMKRAIITGIGMLFTAIAGMVTLLFILSKKLSEINELRKKIDENHRLVAIGKLAAGVAHEIRNPLSSIKGFATYFKDKDTASPKDKEISTIMINEVNRLNRAVSQLLEFSTPVTLFKQPEHLEYIIQNSLKLIENQANENNIKIETKIEKDLNNIMIDKDKISQALLNLYLNSIEAMKDGGVLKVECDMLKNRKNVEIIVSDTGEGISEADMPHIFDPYFSTKPTGTGIGLGNVHNIIKAHNGDIKVKSEKNKGTDFIITLSA